MSAAQKNLTDSQLKSYLIREQVIAAMRNFFNEHDFQEITTPVLNHSLPLEPNLYAFSTQWQTLADSQKLFLSTSPEAALKKMLALGLDKVFAIDHSFRNREPSDVEHNPEFLMLEWYRVNATASDIMKDVRLLLLSVVKMLAASLKNLDQNQITYQEHTIDLAGGWPKLSLLDLFQQHANLDLLPHLTLDKLQAVAQAKGYQTQQATWEQLFNQIFTNDIEPHLPLKPCFLVDFPAKISPLCATQKNNPHLAQRFEFYLAGLEVANGNTEQTDSRQVKQYFNKEQRYRKRCQLSAPPVDNHFLQALEKLSHRQQPLAGIGLGVERLAMILADSDRISKVNPFVL